MSIAASAANVAYGGSVAFSGLLTLAANGAPLGGGRVYLQQSVNGVWTERRIGHHQRRRGCERVRGGANGVTVVEPLLAGQCAVPGRP